VGDLFPRGGVAIFFGLDQAGTELGFLRGKRQRKSAVEKMFDAAHSGVAGFDGADFKGQVADEGNVLLFRFFSDGEKGLAGGHRNDFDEIGAALFEVLDGSAGFLGVADGILLGSSLATGSKERSRGNDMRREERAGLGGALPGEKRVEITAHVSHAGDAVGEKQGQKNLLAPRGIGVDACEMDVHVPKTGEQEFSGGVDGARGFGNLDRCSRAHPSDVAGLDENSLIRLRRATSGINDGDVGYGKL